VFDHSSYGTVFIQVKHNKNAVGVAVLRELVGTMVIRGSAVALLVTSSSFTGGVATEQALAEKEGRIVELVDGVRFLAALSLAERREPPRLADIRAVARPHVTLLMEERLL